MLPLLFPYKSQPEKKEFWFALLDVGQGLAAVVQTQNHTLVYDTGAKFSDYFNAGQAVVIPYLYSHVTSQSPLLQVPSDSTLAEVWSEEFDRLWKANQVLLE